MNDTTKLIISGILGVAFHVPSILMFGWFLQGGHISEDNTSIALIELTIALGLVGWFTYICFSTIIKARRRSVL